MNYPDTTADLAGMWDTAIASGDFSSLHTLVDTRQQLILWAWVGLVPLFLPMMLSFMDDLLPNRIIQILKWVPSSAMMRVIRSSMVGMPTVDNYLPQLAILVFSALLLLILDFRLIGRLDQ